MRSFFVPVLALTPWLLIPACSSEDPDTSATSTTATSSVTSSSTSGSGGGGAAAPMCPVAHTNVPEANCSLLQQDCPSGEVCEVVAVGDTFIADCVPRSGGTKKAGESCSDGADCVAPLICAFDRCTPFCCPDNDEPCDTGKCDVVVSYQMGFEANGCSFQ